MKTAILAAALALASLPAFAEDAGYITYDNGQGGEIRLTFQPDPACRQGEFYAYAWGADGRAITGCWRKVHDRAIARWPNSQAVYSLPPDVLDAMNPPPYNPTP